MTDMKSYWLSKYALSDGISAVQGKPFDGNGKYIDCKGWWQAFQLGTEIHETEAAAKADAEARRLKKIASLRKQLAKLEKLEF